MHGSRSVAARQITLSMLSLLALGLALITVGLTLPRMLDPHTKYGVLLAALAPFGTLTAFFTLLITAPLVRRAGRIRAVAHAITAAASLLLVLHLAWIAPLYIGSQPRAVGSARVVLMTQNFESGEVEALEVRLRVERVDILVVCDAGESQSAAAVRVAGRAGLRHQVTDGGTAVFSRFPISGTTRISDGGSSRVVHITGTPIGDLTVYAVHPAPGYNPAKWAADHRRIAASLPTAPARRTIIAGDLNATLDNAPVRRLLARNYTDAAVQTRSGWQPTWPADAGHGLAGIPLPRVLALDHVLTTDDLAVTGFRRTALPGADHDGLVVSIGSRVRGNQ